jgi:uncharacterized protein DUF4193
VRNIPVSVRVRYTNKTEPGELTPMATTTDYDAPRGNIADLDEDSLEDLKTRRTSTQSALVDLDEAEGDGFDLPGADVTDEELTVAVVPMRGDEFRCSRCFLVHHRSQRVTGRDGLDICRECA